MYGSRGFDCTMCKYYCVATWRLMEHVCLLQEKLNDTSSVSDEMAHHLNDYSKSGSQIVTCTEDIGHTARPEQESFTTHVPTSTTANYPREVSTYRCSNASCHATNTMADNQSNSAATDNDDDSPSSEEEDDTCTPMEETIEPVQASKPPGRDEVNQPQNVPTNATANVQLTSTSKEEHFRVTPLKPVPDDDHDAATAESEVKTGPADPTVRESHGIQGKSQNTQHLSHTRAQGSHNEEVVKPLEESHECNQPLFLKVADINDVTIKGMTFVDIDPHDWHKC